MQIKRLRNLHDLNFIHNDLKLENILVGHQDSHKIYLIDFGLAEHYLDSDNKHLKKVNTSSFSGNLQFASLNSLRGMSHSRRDDIESVFYILAYLINN